MRQINFLIIFAMGLALVLFSLQNTEPATIKVVEGVEFQAPLAVELIIAMGAGAFIAWLFSAWGRLQQMLASRRDARQMQQQDDRIHDLEREVEEYKVQLQQPQQQLPPSAEEQAEADESETVAN
jgi:uncharacterized integral membrane protein